MEKPKSPNDVSHEWAMVLIWEFRGPQSRPTAEHFERHLHEFLAREGFSARRSKVCSEHEGLWLVASPARAGEVDSLSRALKPQGLCAPADFERVFGGFDPAGPRP